MRACSSCGGELAENNRFCPLCGVAANYDPLATQTLAASIAPPQSRPPAAPRTLSGFSSASTISSSSDGSRFPPGTLLAGRYRIIAMLGRGGMGEVYRADDLTLGQQVALKFLPIAISSNPNSVDRFRNEVRVARLVSHPNVCRVYDLGEFEGHLFLSMEYVDGEDLGSLLRRIGRLPEDKALEIARKLCAGLAAAHEKGVLHRDLKPSNVMLDGRGHVLLTDFGLAGLADQIGGAEVRNGTPAYMAPEQLAGTEVTARSDIYSLGLVLYEIVTGKRPFESDTLAGLERARKARTPITPSTLVKDLDPAVERVILRCLETEPSRRPASALAVSAALPGGDPLAAALAAGETPSPEMVAAAGEGSCFKPRVALTILLAIAVGLGAQAYFQYRLNALDRMGFDQSTEVLQHKATETLRRIGYADPPADFVTGFDLDLGLIRYIERNDHPAEWDRVLRERPPSVIFQYRQSDAPIVAAEYHDDKLTPGIVTLEDPPPIVSGMIQLESDIHGRLLSFEAIPPQVLETPTAPSPAPNWNVLFAAADLDAAQFKPIEPQRTWLATSDVRAAWNGTWPGTKRGLHIEAAALRGKPVAFEMISEWRDPSRLADNSGASSSEWVLAIILIVLFNVAPILGLRNYQQQKGDSRGAFRMAAFIFYVQMILWFFRGHFTPTLGLVMPFIMGLCSAIFYGVAMWLLYMALEPYIRRRWPQGIIAWSNVLTGRWHDPVVGRDVMFGAAMGAAWLLIARLGDLARMAHGASLNVGNTGYLNGLRSSLGLAMLAVPDSVRSALVFFFLIFLFRILLRNQWLAMIAFVGLFLALDLPGSRYLWIDSAETILTYGLAALVITRLGLLAFAAGVFVHDLLVHLPVTLNTAAPYFSVSTLMMAIALGFCIWAFRTSIAGQKMWNTDLFG
jgi:predicted Ser/Thr protein kinase